MLKEYENNILSRTKAITENLSLLQSYTDEEEGSAEELVDTITADIKSAAEELKRFQTWARGLEGADKEVALKQCTALNKLVTAQQKNLEAAKAKLDDAALAGGGGGGAKPNYRSVVDQQLQTLDRTGKHIDNAKRSLYEADEHASITEEELERQRKTLLHSKTKVDDTQMELKGAGRILNRMFVRNVAQRASIFGIIAVGGVIILTVLIACLATPPVVDENGTKIG